MRRRVRARARHDAPPPPAPASRVARSVAVVRRSSGARRALSHHADGFVTRALVSRARFSAVLVPQAAGRRRERVRRRAARGGGGRAVRQQRRWRRAQGGDGGRRHVASTERFCFRVWRCFRAREPLPQERTIDHPAPLAIARELSSQTTMTRTARRARPQGSAVDDRRRERDGGRVVGVLRRGGRADAAAVGRRRKKKGEGINIFRKPAHTVAELASARRHQGKLADHNCRP